VKYSTGIHLYMTVNSYISFIAIAGHYMHYTIAGSLAAAGMKGIQE
jgi:hypothetical protein